MQQMNIIMDGVCDYLKRKGTSTLSSYGIGILTPILELQTIRIHGSKMPMG
jgi:hypothetical protein